MSMAQKWFGRFRFCTRANDDDLHGENVAVKDGSTKPAKIIQTKSGRWLLGDTLGMGSSGKVKLATNDETGEQTACKIIPRNKHTGCSQCGNYLDQDYEGREIRTAREMGTLRLLHHPNIVKMRDITSNEHHWYMFLEYVDGGQILDYLIRNGKLKERDARKFCRQIASALNYCHQHNISHRDLKLENILITKRNVIKIIDFDNSIVSTPSQNLTTLCANHYYAAPEILQRKPYSGPKVDVWGFGIIMYTIICGRVPFDDISLAGLHAKIQKGFIDYPRWLSNHCRDLMGRMLSTDPDQRAGLQEVFNHPWMRKGYSSPIENEVPNREPLTLPLETRVIEAMQGFSFGSPEAITERLTELISSFGYGWAVEFHEMEKQKTSSIETREKKLWNILGISFRNQRLPKHAGWSRGSMDDSRFDSYDPIISIYYLTRERLDRFR